MPIANYTTGVKAEDTVTKVMSMLAKAGATEIRTQYEEQIVVGIAFALDTEYGPQAFELPVRVAGVQAVLTKQRVDPRYQTREHAAKVAWRIAHDWLRAQIAIIESGLVTLDEALFPYMLISGETAFNRYVSSQKAIGV